MVLLKNSRILQENFIRLGRVLKEDKTLRKGVKTKIETKVENKIELATTAL